jgi:hypothetical protein
MNLYNDLVLKFEKSDWSKNPEFGVIDTDMRFPFCFQIFQKYISRIKGSTPDEVMVEKLGRCRLLTLPNLPKSLISR